MALDKSITHKKEKRIQYRDCRRFDRTCRNHGSCPWCKKKRLFFDTYWRKKADDQLKDYFG